MKCVFGCCLAVTTVIASISAMQAAENEVTVKGVVINNAHTGEKEKSLFVYVLDGTPEIRAEMDRIMDKYYPDKGLDGDAARAILDQFTARLKYFIDGPHSEDLYKNATYGGREITVLTGTIAEKDGRRWITVSKYAATPFKYPAKMLAPDKPLVMPGKAPLVLKISDKLSLQCNWAPPGKFFMGEPYYQCPQWQESPPHMVTLTKGFYMAEHPITQEIFEAVVGSNPSKVKLAKAPVNVSCIDMYKFCRMLAEKTGRKVRVPTAAEWEYVARSGTSSPDFIEKYASQNSGSTKPMVVKSKAPNAWGFYDILSTGWERVADISKVVREDVVDPQHLPPEDCGKADPSHKHGHFGRGEKGYTPSEPEFIGSDAGDEKTALGFIRFRVVVDEP